MGCCGEKRQALRTLSLKQASEIRVPTRLQNPVNVMHLGDAAIVVRGAHTGLAYLFGARGEVLQVDERDVAELLATHRFALR